MASIEALTGIAEARAGAYVSGKLAISEQAEAAQRAEVAQRVAEKAEIKSALHESLGWPPPVEIENSETRDEQQSPTSLGNNGTPAVTGRRWTGISFNTDQFGH